MSNEQRNDDRGKKRKKKRSHIQMAKKFARQRNHGTDVDSDTYQYMVRILELMKGDFPSAEEKLIFANNVYEQTIGHEVEYAMNQVGSRILDSLLKYASLEVIQRLVEAFKSSLRLLSSDRFASHVLQKILTVCSDRGNRKTTTTPLKENEDACVEVKESEIESYNGIALNLSKYFVNNVEEFVFDTYANHLLRTVLECLGGLIDKSNGNDRRQPVFGERRSVVQEYKNLLSSACNRFLKWPRFQEFGRDELTSGLLQSALYSLKDTFPELVKSYITKITTICFTPGTEQQLSSIFEAESSVRLLEACLAVADPISFRDIYETYFKGNVKSLSLTQGVNFSVQRLFDHCPEKEVFEEAFEEISTSFPDILSSGYTGVLVSLSNACLRLHAKQGAFVTELSKSLGCEGSEKQRLILACTASLKTTDQLEDLKKQGTSLAHINLHGSLIIQAILNFNKPIKMISSLLETEADDLVSMLENPKGSRIVDAFMDSKYIGEKSREKLAKKFKGYWAQLADTTHGSRVLDTMWRWARLNQKILIMEELVAVGESLRSTKTGQIISNKLNVSLFGRNKKDWTETLGKEEKTRALFANIIGKT